MIGLFTNILSFAFFIMFGLILLKVIYPLMKKEMKNLTLDSYFKQVDIYQGRSHWTILKKYLLKLTR